MGYRWHSFNLPYSESLYILQKIDSAPPQALSARSATQTADTLTLTQGEQPEAQDALLNMLQQKFHLHGWDIAVFKPNFTRIPDDGTFDLLNLPFQINRRDKRLLHHCTLTRYLAGSAIPGTNRFRGLFLNANILLIKSDGHVVNMSNIALNPKGNWLNLLASDSVLLHVTIILAALHLTLLLKEKKDSVDALRHQILITKLLNDRFNDKNTPHSDATIMSIACLALIDAS